MKHTATARHQKATTTFHESCNVGNSTNEQKSFTSTIKSFRKKRYQILGARQFQVISSIQKIAIPEDSIVKDILEDSNTSEVTPEHESEYFTMEGNVEEIVDYNVLENTIDLNDQSLTRPTYTKVSVN